MKKMFLFVCAAVLMAVATTSCKSESSSESGLSITVTNDGNGTAVASKGKAEIDTEVTLTATPNDGYRFDRWNVVSGEANLANAAANPTTFVMSAMPVEVKATFIPVAVATDPGATINGVTWATCNVAEPGMFSGKPEVPGMFYQFDRKVGYSRFDPMTSSPADQAWRTPEEYAYVMPKRWEAANNPCPEGWRLPTGDDFTALNTAEKVTAAWTNQNDVDGYLFTDNATNATVFFPAAGYRDLTIGGWVRTKNRYWSSSMGNNSNVAYNTVFDNTGLSVNINLSFGMGCNIRCVK